MKKGVLYSSVIGLSLVCGSLAIFNLNTEKEYYQPRTKAVAGDSHQGAANRLLWMRANSATGAVELTDVLKAREEMKALSAKSKKSAIGLQWSEVGPDNIGGRTRAFLISSQTPGLFFAAGVSGGLFRSTNSGGVWEPVNDMQENLIVTCIAEAPNGDIYYGTGEGLYSRVVGGKNSGFVGAGVFKSTDGGQTFNQIPSTTPSSTGDEFANIGKIEVDPNNSSKIFIAAQRGIRVSTDGGDSWNNPLSGLAPSTDMTMTPSGHIWAKVGSLIYKSTDGNNFTEISSTSPGATGLPRNTGRSRIAVSPEDDNYVYVINTNTSNDFSSAYRSTDGGTTWTQIGAQNSFLNPHSGQGDYNNAVTVDPKDKNRIIVGGVTLWEWSAANGWQQIASNNRFTQVASLWVHSDVHNVVFHPLDKNKMFVCSDGGISRSNDNGLTWVPIVKSYNTIQFWDIGVGADGAVIGGTQDNSNILVNPNAQFFNRTGTTLNSGDGGYADISKLNPDIIFLESQYGNALRSVDYGGSFGNFFDLDRMAPNANAQPGDFAFADFVAPFELYENVFDAKSTDLIRFGADSVFASVGLGGGKIKFDGKFTRPQATTDFIIDGVVIEAGTQTATTDINGTFTGDVSAGSFDPATGVFSVTFNSPVQVEVIAKVAVKYDAGDTVIISSLTNDIPLTRVLSTALAPNQSTTFVDPVQSAFFMGLTGRSVSSGNNQGGIWMTRNAVSDPTATPTWFHIGNMQNGETPTCMAVSNDGDVLYVGCNTGRVYKFSNISNARDSASADIDDFYTGSTVSRPNTSVIQSSVIGGTLPSLGRAVVEINFDPRDNNKLIVCLGNYGSNNNIYYTSNATAASPIFRSVHGNLPSFPVYTGIFNAMGPNGQVIIGTEFGVWSTDDITATSVEWSKDNDGFAEVPVFDLVQKLRVRKDLQLFGNLEGEIYAGTHGRGFWRTMTTQKIGLDENTISEEKLDRSQLNVYPNPAHTNVFVPLNLTSRTDVVINIRDINGKLVRSMKLNKVSKDVENVELNVSTLPTGTYIVTLLKGSEAISGKLIKK
jgi:hypothetical protein